MKAALFDLDGVIVDTEPSYSIFWGGIGRKYNVGIDDFADVIKGTTLTQILSRYFPDAEMQTKIVAELEDYERNMHYVIFPGVKEYVKKLNGEGVKCAIVTSSNVDKMANFFAQNNDIKDYFDIIITDEDVTHSKPDPEPYLLAAKRLGIAPCDCTVFEDSYNGLLSGRRAGAEVVALATTNPAETLADKADRVIYTFNELL